MFDELNRRNAIVYVHPILPQACQDMQPGIGESALEYLFDTARAIASLLYNGSLLRWPNVRFIFPHAGGAMPPLAERVTRMADRDRKLSPCPPRRRWRRSRASISTSQLDQSGDACGPVGLVPPTQVMFGTDYPFLGSIPYTLDPLRNHGLAAADLAAIESGTALRLFPRFAKVTA